MPHRWAEMLRLINVIFTGELQANSQPPHQFERCDWPKIQGPVVTPNMQNKPPNLSEPLMFAA